MSVCGYFSKGKETLMPKGKDTVGIRSEGPVMTGEKSVEQVRREDAIRSSISKPDAQKRQYCKSVQSYDPVLRFHCRLDE